MATLPLPAATQLGLAPAPPVAKTLVAVPGASPTQPVALRYMIVPCVEEIASSSAADMVLYAGAAVEPVALPRIVCAAAVERMNVKAGVVVAVATLVVKRGERVPAENEVTVPPPPVTAVITPPDAVIVVPSTLTAPKTEEDATGRSAGTIARKLGAAADPVVGPARTVFALWLMAVAVTVPEVVTAELGVAESKMPSPVKVTLVTVPDPAGVAQVPSPRQNVEELAEVPLFKWVTPKLPVTPDPPRGSPVALVSTRAVGVPSAGVTKVGDVART